MTVLLVLILLALGIACSQSVSDAQAVTLRWLRLGDLISLSLLAASSVLVLSGYAGAEAGRAWPMIGLLLIGSLVHLMAVQVGSRRAERAIISLSTACATAVLVVIPLHSRAMDYEISMAGVVSILDRLSPILMAWLTGGSLMTMLLGHAYLTAGGEMTQKPFLRLTRLLLVGIVLRAAIVLVFGVGLWWLMYSSDQFPESQTWNAMLILARVAAGLLVPAVLLWMVVECVKIRSNQSATGILYVSSILLLIGELTALSLIADTGLAF